MLSLAIDDTTVELPSTPDAADVEIPYCPRPQFVAYHERKQRFAKLVCHRRFGKTVGCVNDLIARALLNTRLEPAPRYSYIAPTYIQAKDVAWSYLKHYSAPLPGIIASESELWVELPNHARIRLYGADNYDRMRGLYNDGVVIDEPAQQDPRAWPEVIRPTLADFAGWATMIGTPRGHNWFYSVGRLETGELDPSWYHLTLRASDTIETLRQDRAALGIDWDEELASARATLTTEQYQQEFECSFEAAVIGAYYGRLMAEADTDKRICGVPYDPSTQVYTAWDLGIGDATAIWFAQVVGREIHLIDYYENSGQDLGHYAREVERRNYLYARHFVPHDAQARELGTGKSRLEVLETLGLRNVDVCPKHRIEDGINAVRTILPKCWFDTKKCARGIDALRLYRSDYDDRLQTLRNNPVHDWTSHCCLIGETLVEIDRGHVPIKDVKIGDLAKTPAGWARITAAGPVKRAPELIEVMLADGRSLCGTPEHKIFTTRGLLTLDALRYSDKVLSEESTRWHHALSHSKAANIGFRDAIIRVARLVATTGQKTGEVAALRTCIAQYGNTITALLQKASTFIIAMAMAPTTNYQTLSSSSVASINANIRWRGSNAESCSHLRNSLGSGPPFGIVQKKGVDGTRSTAKTDGKTANGICSSVRNAVARFARRIRRGPNSVISIARWQPSDAGADAPLVYDLTVEKHHCYLANGILVSNSDAFRYLALSLDNKVRLTGFNRHIEPMRISIA